jgi:hypothetical protein
MGLPHILNLGYWLSVIGYSDELQASQKTACRTVAGAANVLAAVSSEGISPSESTVDSVKTLLQT